MSSHREAPEISKDPVADNTDVYAFVSPDKPDTVTMIANFIPLEEPAGGPNFYEFGDDVFYDIIVRTNQSTSNPIRYRFKFRTEIRNPNTLLYNTGPISSLDDPNWNVRQFYSVTKIKGTGANTQSADLAANLPCPPVRIGPRSTPNYAALADAAIHTLPTGEVVFAGQRDDPFFVDLGSIFDLGALRPFNNLHLIPLPVADGKDGLKGYNVHTIAIQVRKSDFVEGGTVPTDPMDPNAVIGVWAAALRQRATIREPGFASANVGPFVQVSRLGNPLINEAVIPLAKKDLWNMTLPINDEQFVQYYEKPELQTLLPILYPNVFPNLAAYTKPRADLVAILLTGIPSGIVPGFQNFTGTTQSDLLRLNMAVPPSANPDAIGLIAGDAAGFPNGRRLMDNIVAIELRAIAGATIPLVDKSFTPDQAAALLTDGSSDKDMPLLTTFPYIGLPNEGYSHSHD